MFLDTLHQVNGAPSLIVPAPDLAPRVAELEAQAALLTAAGEDNARRYVAERTRADVAQAALAEFRQRVVEVAQEQGRRRGWCSELDNILVDELDLGDLVRRTVTVEIIFQVDIDDVDDDGPDQGQVDRAARAFIDDHLDSSHWTEV